MNKLKIIIQHHFNTRNLLKTSDLLPPPISVGKLKFLLYFSLPLLLATGFTGCEKPIVSPDSAATRFATGDSLPASPHDSARITVRVGVDTTWTYTVSDF